MYTPCDGPEHICPYADIYTGYEDEMCRNCCGLGVDENDYPDEYYEDEYTSSIDGDYSPSDPWNAPGMVVSDFI